MANIRVQTSRTGRTNKGEPQSVEMENHSQTLLSDKDLTRLALRNS
jgi:hypothetical protein